MQKVTGNCLSPNQRIKQRVSSGNFWSNMGLNLTPPLIRCVTLDQLHSHSVPRFLIRKMGEMTVASTQVCKALSGVPGTERAPNQQGWAECVQAPPAHSRPRPLSSGISVLLVGAASSLLSVSMWREEEDGEEGMKMAREGEKRERRRQRIQAERAGSRQRPRRPRPRA